VSTTDTLSEAALALRLRDGDARAQRIAWDRYASLVRGLIRRSLGRDGDSEDLVQEVFVRFFRSIARLRDPDAMRSYLVGVTVRVVRGEIRRRKVRSVFQLGFGAKTLEPFVDPSAAQEPLACLESVLARVSDQARLLFVLRYVEQLELAEIEAVLGVSRSTLKRRLKHASERVFELARREPALLPYLRETPALRDGGAS
jgi:RNA polymerase sigma-70 factor (ECF subfamily)